MTSGPCVRRYSRGVRRPRRVAHLFRAPLQNAAHHHARARGDGRSAVGHFAGVGGVHLDVVVRPARACRRRSARASSACPARSPCCRRESVTPRSVSASDAFDASFTSPPPVKPEPWKNSERPMPRFVARRAPGAARLKSRALHRLAQHLQRARSPCRAADPWRSCRPAGAR